MTFFKKSIFPVAAAFAILIALTGCEQPKVINDLSEASFNLINQDSAGVTFPQDFKGSYVVAAFIYTHCPDVCRITTANMSNISRQLQNAANVRFVEITFDPKRDTPSDLKNYMQLYGLNEEKFTMLTGKPSEVNALLDSLNIKTAISYTDTLKNGDIQYYFNHTDRILIIDKKGRVRFQYPGSLVPPENVIEDLNKLR